MLRFSSARERRLWLWTAILVAGIYATLGLASSLATWYYSQNVAAVVFLVCMFLVFLCILTQGLKTRPRGLEIGVGLGIAGVYVMVCFRLTFPERSHLFEYGVVAVFIFEALCERARNGFRVPAAPLQAILLTTLVGTVDEFIQLFLPSRVFDWVDILFNFLAGLMAVAAMVILRWARRLAIRIRAPSPAESGNPAAKNEQPEPPC